ncbi:hypothetical protein KIN20_010483 [Parelaphostrongylus tenuis]|uniref:Uncharacterized protein n=1 Tax=Parelaphostrongylus tenuis TaxID=148309 RepID=A0AAD5MCL6_PARTN|nr:hypothetical protein KIN20_010483 [Parelaphostrongylus tenuis]
MIRPLMFSYLIIVPIVSSILPSYRNNQLMSLLGSTSTAADAYPEWVLQATRAVKKYDRNCFFSPVQCMLGFTQGQEHPIVYTANGNRRLYYRK